MPPPYVLDTNTIIYILQRDSTVVHKWQSAMRRNACIYLCPVVYFEVLRGFVLTPDAEQERVFRSMRPALEWQDLAENDWDRAASLWAASRQRGRRPKDADILIAAYAGNRNATIVTNNVRDFLDPDIARMLENWSDPAGGTGSRVV